jgi:ferredoxin-NADP reductase
MQFKQKKIVIFQEFPTEETIIFNKNLRKVDFKVLNEQDREYIQKSLENKKIESYSSDHLESDIHEDYKQVYYICNNPRRRKIKKMKLSNHENFSYKFRNEQKAYCKSFFKKSFSCLYNLAKLSLLLLIGILTYLLIALSHIKWPEFNKKKDDKSKCDDDPGAPGCCSCEEIKEKGESMSHRIKNSIRNSEYSASKDRLKNLATVGSISALVSVPFSDNIRTKEEGQVLDSMTKNIDRIQEKIDRLDDRHLYGCDCDGLYKEIREFRNYIYDKLVYDCKINVNENDPLVDYIKKYTDHLKKKHICEPEFGEKLTKMVGQLADNIYSDQMRLIQ